MPKSTRSLIVLLAWQITTGFLAAQDVGPLAAVLEARVPRLMAAGLVPGLSMAIVRDGRIVWRRGFGVRVAGEPEKVDQETVFEAASMSKPLFTYAALQLVGQGRLDLDRPLDDYLPEPYLPDQPLAGRITARMVMLHRTGLPNWRKGGWLGGGSLTVLREPGTAFTYSGEGYTYLQTAVAQLTGQPVGAWMDEVLLGPLQMTRSSYVWKPVLADNFAGGHDKSGRPKARRRFYERANAAYSLYTTPTDYARFLIEMMRADRSASHSLRAETVAQMTTLQVGPEGDSEHSRRALGWVVAAPEQGGWVCHSGSNGTGFRCTSRFDPARGAGCVIMTNADGGADVWRDILAVIDTLPAAGEAPQRAPAGTTWGDVQRTIKYEYRVANPTAEATGRFDVFVPLPLASPRQEIHYLRLSERGRQRVFDDVHGQRLAHYTFDGLGAGEQVDVGFVVGITLRNMRWDAGGGADPEAVLTPEQCGRYLRAESAYSMDSELMRRSAAELTRGATNDLDKLTRIHDHVIGKVRYVRDGRWDPAAVVLARGTGSCSEYNYVLSGLCRLAGLPTRAVGGSTSGFRELPTTDTVFHRWTEVFLRGYGWFPADCSRDANPIRGRRSHFGRVYTDAVVWCRQAGGEQDSLGWDYRAQLRPSAVGPGVQGSHRTRWFPFFPEDRLTAASAWLQEGAGSPPPADPLECALLRWDEAGPEGRRRGIRALAAAGRNECLRRAATLPEAEDARTASVRELCASAELAETVLERSRDVSRFGSWFRSNESRLVAASDGKFRLAPQPPRAEEPVTAARSARIWRDLAAELAGRLAESLGEGRSVVVMPVVDQTLAGLGEASAAIQARLKEFVAGARQLRLLDEAEFGRCMAERGPGSGEYWALANGDGGQVPVDLIPDFILVPLCITERAGKASEAVLYQLECKVLELATRKYTRVLARCRRQPGSDERSSARGVLVAGGDTVLARWEHDFVGRYGPGWPLAAIAPVLSAADAALCNLECCVSLRGAPADKGERCPFYYRARPEMLQCLTGSGIDIVTAANNHGGDYGPASASDTARWCEQAGLVCVGIGDDLAHAGEPRLVRIGPVRVAIVGIDATMPRSRAGEGRPGTHYVEERDLDAFRQEMQELGRRVQGRCDLLALTIHWGRNWVRETQQAHREMARIAFANGVDFILGHSAHRLQGVEVVDGKPVVYDMGNLLFDCVLEPEGRQSALFRLHLSVEGVHRIEVLPVQALEGRTVPAGHEDARQALAAMQDLCRPLGTHLVLDEDLESRPLGVIEIAEPRATARTAPDASITFTELPVQGNAITPGSPEVLVSEIPGDACRAASPALLAPNVELLAWRLPDAAPEAGILPVTTWWRTTGPVDRDVMLALRLQVAGETPRRGTPWYTRHDAGDWTVPLARLKPGQIVEDRYPARLAGLPAGPCKVYALVLATARPEESRILGEQQLLGEVELAPRTR